MVTTSDSGSGIGYSSIMIRGSDQTRVNVTINGVPYNDSESMMSYWVNLPDFSSSIESIQVQRGAGTSTNGPAAFGGTINILTNNGTISGVVFIFLWLILFFSYDSPFLLRENS